MRVLVPLVVLLAACGSGEADDPVMQSPAAPSEASTAAPTDGGGEQLTGTFGGDGELEGGCSWLDDGTTRWEVQYPEGWTVTFNPLTLTGPDGETAGDGDVITVTGAPRTDLVTTCQVGPVVVATGVELGG